MAELNGILPAVRDMKDFEKLLTSDHEYIIFLESRLSQIKSLVNYSKRNNKKVLVHADLIQGLKTDDYGVEFIFREIKPDGIVSTRGNVISLAKQHDILAVQRMFAVDSHALENTIQIINRVKPDYIEIMPGIIPALITEVSDRTGIPVIAGGLIRTDAEVQRAYDSGAKAISTSDKALWGL
ncbi:glycerol-3-phosphate responsive antiterminator GlpP [Virgibacillus dakarensis]|uniref:glycerol-3-phosphate responsive antiterminator n=1 Tax=Bacillaceae TaxID=186817 RepID=UPI000B44D0C6|nr:MULTISPECIES: glycerol-3-phosphate responsive antiterminator [Bacillaceae]MBT2218193.1 glycerol-3-phosphate responsive antiterminator [Virgibacillus dakarensis]MTW87965.1 glycerol-3-phosphate responsive antiterminator GlpP [Virgibacillus dakarensis]